MCHVSLPTMYHVAPGIPHQTRLYGRSDHFLYKYTQDTGSRSRTGVRSTRKDRPTFVLLHGLAGSTASWDEVTNCFHTIKLSRRRL